VIMLYSRRYRLPCHPCALTQMWKELCHVDRAVRTTLTQKPETDCDRDCMSIDCRRLRVLLFGLTYPTDYLLWGHFAVQHADLANCCTVFLYSGHRWVLFDTVILLRLCSVTKDHVYCSVVLCCSCCALNEVAAGSVYMTYL
jgi:hypothetical protein